MRTSFCILCSLAIKVRFIEYTQCIIAADSTTGFDAWRRLGDVISSLLFLGHNEDNKRGPACPLFLAEVRRNCFAQIYLADKELLLFLGRPPRLSRVFCCFQVPRILQVLFLLHKGNLQQPEPAASIHHSKALIVAKEMLSLVVECISFRKGLVDSGCSLNWTVCFHTGESALYNPLICVPDCPIRPSSRRLRRSSPHPQQS